jgi:hypothetical protein
MRAQIIALTAAILAAAPLAAQAQSLNRNVENELKMRQAQEQLRQSQREAPAQQAEQRLNDLDQRVRTQQNIDSLTPPRGPTLQPMDVSPSQITGGIDLSAQSAMMNKELAGETARLRALNPPN